MGFKDLLAQNVLLRWLGGKGASYDLALSMTGVRLGERFLVAGAGDPGLITALAGKVGYTGRACAADADAAVVARAARTAERAGVLVEVEHTPLSQLPLDAGAFDLVVCRPGQGSAVAADPAALAEFARVLRPGGRCLFLLDVARHRGAAAGDGGRAAPESASLIERLRAAGFRAARELAQRDGLAFVEAIKAAE